MKRLIKILFILLVFMPIFIKASESSNYSTSYNKAVNYINRGNYTITRSRYIKTTDKSHFITKEEYETSRGTSGYSYLFDGVEYWTSLESDGIYNIINHTGDIQVVNSSSKYSARDVEFVKNDNNGERVLVQGSGTYNNPWTFEPMYEVKVITNEKYGYISNNGGNYTSLSKYIVRGTSASFSVSAKDKYMYITNDCGARYLNGQLTIDNVRRNMTCKVVFGTGRYKITLNQATPSIIYLKFKDNYYSDSDYKNVITTVTPPSKPGFTFLGYKYNGVTIIDQDGKINRASVNAIYQDLELNPSYFVDNPANPTISGGTTKVHNYEDTNLTCNSNGSYDSSVNVYYEFGYATSIENFNNDTINWLGSASTTPTYKVNKDAFSGTMYYACRIYISDGTNSSSTVKSSTYTTMSLLHPRIDFDATTNGGAISGTTPLYSSYNSNTLYNGRTSDTTASIPSVNKVGYSISGWYTTSGTKVINSNGTLVASVTNWTNSNSKFILTNLTDTANTHKLVAQYTANKYTVSFNANGGSGGQTSSVQATYDSAMPTISSTAPTKSGYTFTGWYDQQTGGTKYYNSNGSSAKNYDKASATTLYAHWEDINKPIVTITAYNYDSTRTNNIGTTVLKSAQTFNTDGTFTVNSNWINSGVTFKIESSDEGSSLSQIKEMWNLSGLTTDSGDSYTGGSSTYTSNLSTKYISITANGYRKGKWIVTDSQGNTNTIVIVAKMDTQAPTCELAISNTGITLTRNDNLAITGYGISNSTTASYNSTASVTLANGHYYGHVKDNANNTVRCGIDVNSPNITKYTLTRQTCSRVASGSYLGYVDNTYSCTTSTCSKTGCNCTTSASGTYSSTNTCTTSTCNTSGCSCSYTSVTGTYTTTTTNTCTTSTCSKSGCSCVATSASGTYKENIIYTGVGASSQCERNCSYTCECAGTTTNTSCSCPKINTCTTSTCSKTGCSCTYRASGTYTTTTTNTCTVSTCDKTGCTCSGLKASGSYSTTNTCTTSTCDKTGCSCTTSASGSYTVRETDYYGCSTSTCSYSGCSCNYEFSSRNYNNQTSCSVESSFTCDSTTNGNTYISACTPTEYNCSTGYTSLTSNTNYCYKRD